MMALACVCLTTSLSPKAQYYYSNDRYYENAVVFELGGSLGVMNALTDVGGRKGIGKKFIKDLNTKNFKPSFGFYVLAMVKNILGARLEATFGNVQAYDSILKSVKTTTFGRYERNLSFRSKITDFQLTVEVHPLMFKNYGDEEPPFLSPYIIGGIGYFSFNPQANLNGQWYSLQPLRTEGQGFKEYPNRKPYSLSQINFPVGVGIRYEVSSSLYARFELVYRILRTDYLDDVSTEYIDPALFPNYLSATQSALATQLFDRQGELDPTHDTVVGGQRGDPTDNDAFFSVQLKFGVTIARQKR
jgi:hypothetical protein